MALDIKSTESATELLHRIEQAHSCAGTATRLIVAIFGAPGAGKSTLAETLMAGLNRRQPENCAIVLPMDGFHFDNAILDEAGWRSRKGAPFTFDVGGLHSLLTRIRSTDEPVYAPAFDRDSDLSRNCAISIRSSNRIVLVEGNYLMLKAPGWQELSAHFDLKIGIEVDFKILKQRLINRWVHFGFALEDAKARAEDNDLPNAKLVSNESQLPDIVYLPAG